MENALIQVLKAPDEDLKEAYQYYVNQLYEVDQMIGDLVKALEKRKEDTILVLYGDHLPSLDMEKEDLHDSNLYQTQYVIWDNMGLSRKEKNIASYQLYPEVLGRAGIHEGNITRFHQEAEWKTKSYHEDLKVLEYDMLYGEKYAFKGLEPYQPTELLMGTEPVKVDDVVKNEQGYLMAGSNFTPYSHVLFDGEELSVHWIDSGHIQILDEIDYDGEEEETEETASPEPAEEGQEEEKEDIPDAFLVQVQSDGGTVLAESEVLLWKETSAGKTEMP